MTQTVMDGVLNSTQSIPLMWQVHMLNRIATTLTIAQHAL